MIGGRFRRSSGSGGSAGLGGRGARTNEASLKAHTLWRGNRNAQSRGNEARRIAEWTFVGHRSRYRFAVLA